MKNLVLFCLLVSSLTLGLTACHREPEPTESYLKNEAVRKLYYEKTLGKWYFEKKTSREKYYCSFEFKEKGVYNEREILIERDSMLVNGVPTYGDWQTAIDTTFTDKWRMGWSQDFDIKYIAIYNTSPTGGAVVNHREFITVDNDNLVFANWLYGNDLTVFKRGNPGPSF
ncbi:hypothetical protein [Prevotella corporis]|nr:hypothetical protein [Prevotella corporis]